MSGRSVPRCVLAMLTLMLLAHALLMSSEQVHAAPGVSRDASDAAHTHCTSMATRCGLHSSPQLTDPAGHVPNNACGVLTPWKPTGGDGGERLDRAAPVIAAPDFVLETRPIPGEPAHLDPPDVRRAFLQVYRN